MRFDDRVLDVCAVVPGLLRCALVVLPEGLLIGGTGAEHVLDQEPLVRVARACMGAPIRPIVVDSSPPRFVEYAFVLRTEIVVIQRGRNDSRLALATACSRKPNLALVLSATRQAIQALEGSIALDELGS
jgi:hypothetical protein